MKAVSLRTNYRVDPLGIDDPNPLLRWKCEGGVKQTAYQVTVPANCVAELVLPGQAARFLTSGCHSIEV